MRAAVEAAREAVPSSLPTPADRVQVTLTLTELHDLIYQATSHQLQQRADMTHTRAREVAAHVALVAQVMAQDRGLFEKVPT